MRFREEFGNIDKFSVEFGCRIIAIFEFLFKFGRIAVLIFYFFSFKRKKIWTSSYETIMAHNKRADKGLETYRQGLNEFSDMVNSFN